MKNNKKNKVKTKRKLSNKNKKTKVWSNQISMQVNGTKNKGKVRNNDGNYFNSEKYYMHNDCYECPNCGMDIPNGYSECIECGWYEEG